MKKRTEKQPVDGLFARKLGNMSLPPSPDSFARLQARMGQDEPETSVVFWRNPAVQRYMAVAACVLLVCLFGWFYLSTETPISGKATVAVNGPAEPTVKKRPVEQPKSDAQVATTRSIQEQKTPGLTNQETSKTPSVERGKVDDVSSQMDDRRRFAAVNPATRKSKTSPQQAPAVTSTEQVAKTEINTPPVEPTTERQVTATTDKPAPIAERVLVVTIAEPKALIAARQAVKEPAEGKEIAAVTDKPEKNSKAANLWQQVKRMKQGEIFARKDADEDERSLLNRAYSGLKQTFDKDKSTKQ